MATQDTVTQLIAAIRRVRRIVPGALDVALGAHDYESAGKPLIAWDDPVAKSELVDALVGDALGLLEKFEGKELNSEATGALGLLALVAGQDVEQDDDGTWRIAQKVAKDRIISVVDPESRHMHKSRSEYRDGYKAHIAVEPETGLVTAAILTPANVSDAKTAIDLMTNEPEGLEVLADSAYGSGETRAHLRRRGHRQLIKPIPLRHAIPGGFDRDDFTVDHAMHTVTCPAGVTVVISPKGNATFGAKCRGCVLRHRCTNSREGLHLTLHPHDDELTAARTQWRARDGLDDYRRWRPMVERSIAWVVAKGNRRVRFRGVEKNQLGLSLRLAALNLRRMINLGLANDGEWMLRAT